MDLKEEMKDAVLSESHDTLSRKNHINGKAYAFRRSHSRCRSCKSNKIKKTATSDFMEIERQRGISVATSVMGFEYNGIKINILDTPGHQDFAEDTFRTLTACDSVIIVIDASQRSRNANP